FRRAWLPLWRDSISVLAALVFAAIGAVAYIVPPLIPIDPYQQSLRDSLLAPGTPGHLLGTDNFRRDVLLRLVDGGRVSLSVGLVAVAISATVGGLVGLVAGYSGGWLDRILIRIIDVQLGFPGILLALVIITILGSG